MASAAQLDRANNSWLPLKESKIVLIQDSREKFGLECKNLRVIVRALETADVSIVGLENKWGIECKWSLEDLACYIGFERPRFEKELRRLASFDFARLLILGSEHSVMNHEYRSDVTPAAIMGSLFTWSCRYRIPFQFCASRQEAARLCELYAWYYASEIIKTSANFSKAQQEVADAAVLA